MAYLQKRGAMVDSVVDAACSRDPGSGRRPTGVSSHFGDTFLRFGDGQRAAQRPEIPTSAAGQPARGCFGTPDTPQPSRSLPPTRHKSGWVHEHCAGSLSRNRLVDEVRAPCQQTPDSISRWVLTKDSEQAVKVKQIFRRAINLELAVPAPNAKATRARPQSSTQSQTAPRFGSAALAPCRLALSARTPTSRCQNPCQTSRYRSG
jgi:hypothetical protein